MEEKNLGKRGRGSKQRMGLPLPAHTDMPGQKKTYPESLEVQAP